MLIQGARSAMPELCKSDSRVGEWLRGLVSRAHANTAVVALAAKMARIVWALLRVTKERSKMCFGVQF
jgi:transposase